MINYSPSDCFRLPFVLTLASAFAIAATAAAQIAVSAHENKVVNVDGTDKVVESPPPDNAMIPISASRHPR